MGNDDLLNPANEPVLRRWRLRLTVRAGAICVVLLGGAVGGFHHEQPFLPHLLGLCPTEVKWWDCPNIPLLSVGLGLLSGVVFAAYVAILLMLVPVRRVITCRGCGGRGWILDLEPDGLCPRCGCERFDARIAKSGLVSAGTIPYVAIRRIDNVSGAELLRQRRLGESGYI